MHKLYQNRLYGTVMRREEDRSREQWGETRPVFQDGREERYRKQQEAPAIALAKAEKLTPSQFRRRRRMFDKLRKKAEDLAKAEKLTPSQFRRRRRMFDKLRKKAEDKDREMEVVPIPRPKFAPVQRPKVTNGKTSAQVSKRGAAVSATVQHRQVAPGKIPEAKQRKRSAQVPERKVPKVAPPKKSHA